MKYLSSFFLLTLLILIVACDKNSENELIVDKYLFEQIIDSLNSKHALKSKEILIGRYESDEVMSFIRSDLEAEFRNDSVGPGSLVKELIPYLGDSSYFNLKFNFEGYNIVWSNTGKKDLGNNNRDKKCILYLSKTVYSTNQKVGCLYVSIGELKSPAGYIVFISKPDNNWEIFSIMKKWG